MLRKCSWALAFMLFGFGCCCFLITPFGYVHKNKIKTIEVIKEVPESLVITIPQRYNLEGTEYVKRVLNDIVITSYNNHSDQTDDSPNITATSRPVRENMVAASPDLLTKGLVHYGDLVYIDCMKQWYTVEDTMNKRFERRLDIFLFDKAESLKINKKCNIKVIHINK